MMSSQSVNTIVDPVFQSKMPLLDGTIASTGLSKPQHMSGFLGKQMLQYNGAYFTYDPRGKDGEGFTPPWRNSKSSLVDGRSPVSHLSGIDGQHHIIYRQDSNSSEEGHCHSSPPHHAPVKQAFTLYTKSPGISSPTAAASGALRKQKTASENASPPSENSVYLAIPKPVYVHNPCCNELGCVMGQRYSVEHGSPRIPNPVYEHDWMQTDTHYTERPPIQRNAQDTLPQQKGLQIKPSAEPLNRITVETYSPGRARTFPGLIDPNYGSYPCTPTRTLYGSPSEQSQRLLTPPRGYPSLYPSRPIYEHITSEVYREHSPMTKYGQLTQHPMFYYSQANVEVENGTQFKQREDVPVILKHTISNPREHYMVPHSLHGEIPLPGTETLPNHALMQGFDYPCYAVPRFHFNASQIGAPLKSQHGSPSFPSSHINVSPSSQYMEHPMASATNLHKDKPNTSLCAGQSHNNSPFPRVDQTSPARRVSQPGVSPPSIQTNRFFPPLTSLHVDRPVFPPTGLSMDRILDYSSCDSKVMCLKKPKSLPVSPAKWLPRSSHHSSDRVHPAVPNCANIRKIIYSPAATAPGNQQNGPVSSSGTAVLKGNLKRSISHSSSPIIIKDEDRDLCEVEQVKKRQRGEMEKGEVGNETDSPPMPVIDNVFSLAPYKAYLQASGGLFPGRIVQSAEQREDKTRQDIKAKRPTQDEQQSLVCLNSKTTCADTPTEKPAVEIFEPKNIKVEKVHPSNPDDSSKSPVSQRYCSKITIKKEPEETCSFNSEPMLVIKKCEPDVLEGKSSLADETASHESKPGEVTVQMNLSSQAEICRLYEQVVTLQPKSTTPPQPPESKLDFKNIPPQCLKLSNYNLIFCDVKHSCPAPLPERPPVQPIPECIPKLEVQMPVRKHFFEMHHSLSKLVSNFVLASSEQELRTWLSKLELAEVVSPPAKVQKVSCLLGVKAREVWLNEEMKSALHKVLDRLREYTAQERCPFPHVMRTGAVFLPMLVVKELLFPMVQGSFIDQVLQEHRVELRPTTLSEEKLLIQFHKRACSSKLRRLMSLKHLPDIYADAVNLMYHTCVCKHLESTSPDVQKRVQD
uniref:Si:dkey-73n10.1 n=1 Tax=Cyclopterus lumpus TaxID=8103 RepID=A0A8C2WFL5_CYCLU